MAKLLTAKEKAAIKERLSQATDGPWAWEETGEKCNSWGLGLVDPPQEGKIEEHFDERTKQFEPLPIVVEAVCTGEDNFANARFIAAARTDVERLLSDNEKLEARIAKLEGVARCLKALERLENFDLWSRLEQSFYYRPSEVEDLSKAMLLVGDDDWERIMKERT